MIRGLNRGIGFAIPSNLARQVIDHLVKTGKFTRSKIGVAIRGLREDQEFKNFVAGVEDGVVIRDIIKGGTASKSDLKPGDVVTSVNGKPVKTSRELKELISYTKVGDFIDLDVVRIGKANKKQELKIKVQTEAINDEAAAGFYSKSKPAREESRFGLTVESLDKETAEKLELEIGAGVLVAGVDPQSAAAEKGIKPGDIVTEIDRQTVSNVKQFQEAIKAADPKAGVLITYISDGTRSFTILKESGD
jgi:serine protease Do